MAPQRIGRRALLPALGLGVCMAAMTAASHAQDFVAEDGLMYVKRLLATPGKASADDQKVSIQVETAPPPAQKPKGFYEEELQLRSLSSDSEEAGSVSRVINGKPSRPGYWKSTVHMEISRGVPGVTGLCGGSVIDPQWVLTAAHCVFNHKQGGLRPLEWVTVFEGSQDYQAGRKIRVAEAHVHRRYQVLHPKTNDEQHINDIALLKLETSAQVPRQKLAAAAGLSTFLKAGDLATVIGWGVTEQGKLSKVLLQADVPIVAEGTCHSIYPEIGKAAFCAGLKQGGVDTCQGDSGGPLFVSGPNGEHVQAGITSFGKNGCAKADSYGVYSNIGQFEDWIKERLPSASFASPPSSQGGSLLSDIAGFKIGGAPSARGQVTVDLKHVACPNDPPSSVAVKDVNQVKPGACIRVRITSGVSGHLRVYSLNAKGIVHTMFPNPHIGGEQAGATDGRIEAGRTIGIPGGGDGFYFDVSPPYGKAHVIAIVAGAEVGLPKIAEGRALERSTSEFIDELKEISRQINAHPLVPRAVGTRQYEVVE